MNVSINMSFVSYFMDLWISVPCMFVTGATIVFWIGRIRPLFPVRVTCWFCNGETKVPYGNKNCWDCPQCDQYNGFNKDGDYNKPIPAQFEEDLNHPMGCKKEEFLTRHEVLCGACSANQSTKIRLLAQFESSNRQNFDNEVSRLTQYLEDRYKLCPTCENKVSEVVQEQDRIINCRLNDSLRSRLNSLQAEKDQFAISPFLDTDSCLQIRISYLFHTVEVVSSLGLALRQIQLDADQTGVWHDYVSALHPLLLKLDVYAWLMVVTLIVTGILAKVLVTRERIVPVDFINSVFLLLVLFTQSDLFHVFETGSLLEAAIFTGCHVTAILCLLTKRKLHNPMYVLKLRRSLEYVSNDGASSCNSSVNHSSFVTSPSQNLTNSSHYQTNTSYYQTNTSNTSANSFNHQTNTSHTSTIPSQYQTSPSHYQTSPSHFQTSTSHSLTNPSQYQTSSSQTLTSPSHSFPNHTHYQTNRMNPTHNVRSQPHNLRSSAWNSRSRSQPKRAPRYRSSKVNRSCNQSVNGEGEGEGQDVNLSFTVFKMESVNLGCNPPSYSGSYTRSRTNSVSSNHSSRSDYAGSLCAQEAPNLQPRRARGPLITPSRFTPTLDHQRQTHAALSHGITPSSASNQDENKIHKGPFNNGHNGYSNSTTFHHQRPHSPFSPFLVTQFGESPYTIKPLPSDGRRDVSECNVQTASLHRTNSFTCIREETNRDSEDEISDSDSVTTCSDTDDSVSDFTSVSQHCTNSSQHSETSVCTASTRASAKRHRFYPWILVILSLSIVVVMLPGLNFPLLNT